MCDLTAWPQGNLRHDQVVNKTSEQDEDKYTTCDQQQPKEKNNP